MNYRTNYIEFKISGFQLQPYHAHSGVLQSHIKPLQKKQQSEMSTFVLHGRFPWRNTAGVDDQTNVRKNGWAPLGQACVRRTSFLRGQKYSILPALSVDGIVALDIFEGSVNREQFLTFLHNHLVSCQSMYFYSCAYPVVLGPTVEPLSYGSQCGYYGQLLDTS